MRSRVVAGALFFLAACGTSGEPREDASLGADAIGSDAELDAPMTTCTDQQAATLITTYCNAGFMDGNGMDCVSDVGACESRGAFERMTTAQSGCLCYLCPLYQYANDHMVCATNNTPPGYNLEQCLGGTLRCP